MIFISIICTRNLYPNLNFKSFIEFGFNGFKPDSSWLRKTEFRFDGEGRCPFGTFLLNHLQTQCYWEFITLIWISYFYWTLILGFQKPLGLQGMSSCLPLLVISIDFFIQSSDLLFYYGGYDSSFILSPTMKFLRGFDFKSFNPNMDTKKGCWLL